MLEIFLILLNPIIPKATSKVLAALKINTKFRNLSFLKGDNVIPDKINVSELNILFKKIN